MTGNNKHPMAWLLLTPTVGAIVPSAVAVSVMINPIHPEKMMTSRMISPMTLRTIAL